MEKDGVCGILVGFLLTLIINKSNNMKIDLSFIIIFLFLLGCSEPRIKVKDQLTPLSANSIHFDGFFEEYIQKSINNWNKGVVPYPALVEKFRSGREFFAQGEMWGKAVRSGCMFYCYTHDPELKKILKATVKDLLSAQRENGSISCSAIPQQPDGPGGDLWERKYVLLGLDGYYNHVEKDPDVLQAMIEQADCILSQIGPSPKVSIVDQGWSPNHIESSTILEPIMRLYKLTGLDRYLDFAKYIIDEGGAKGFDIIEDAYNNEDPFKIGGVYPKAYEMMSLFEGLVEYYRVTGDEHLKTAFLNLYHNIIEKEITIIGNGGGDQPYHPKVYGEAWDNTAIEQTNPNIERMMETCVGVTWIKLCSQILRLTNDPLAVDMIEKYAYNGLIGAMKPEGDGFSYVNLLNGIKTNKKGWGGVVDSVYVTCCNLNGPMGLAYLPYVAVMNSETGPVVNLYNAATVKAYSPKGDPVTLDIKTDYPGSGEIIINVIPKKTAEKFKVNLRIPKWSKHTNLTINGAPQNVVAGTYAEIERKWEKGDQIKLILDMRCRIIDAPHGSNRAGDHFQALVRGPIVLARDENIDEGYNHPVSIVSKDGFVEIIPEQVTLSETKMQFRVPVIDGYISMVDYASVNNWNGKHICTWIPQVGE